jgi:hypothetical protein
MYEITQYTRDKARQLGVEVRPSKRKGKKIDVFKDGHHIASVGATGYSDYPTYLKNEGPLVAKERRRLYHIRHTQDTLNESLAKYLLW